MEISHGKWLTQAVPQQALDLTGYLCAAATLGHPEVESWEASTIWTTSETQEENNNGLKTAQTNSTVENLADPTLTREQHRKGAS